MPLAVLCQWQEGNTGRKVGEEAAGEDNQPNKQHNPPLQNNHSTNITTHKFTTGVECSNAGYVEDTEPAELR